MRIIKIQWKQGSYDAIWIGIIRTDQRPAHVKGVGNNRRKWPEARALV